LHIHRFLPLFFVRPAVPWGTDKRQDREELNLSLSRYITYFGLCVATFIIFQRSVFIAGIVGMLVAVYVSLSEFWLRKL
jgi:hypothetical protein